VRPSNHDRVGSARTPFGDVFVLSDGKTGGAQAAKATVDGFIRHLQQQGPFPLAKALEQAHAEFTSRLPSTAVAAVIIGTTAGTRAAIASCGDSRAYLLRGNRLGLITNSLVSPDLSIKEIPLQHGDGLLLCSDGLWRQVGHADLEAIAVSPLSATAASAAFLHLALQAGGADNISLQWMRFAEPAPPQPLVRRWFGMRRDVAGALILLAIALVSVALWLLITNASRPLERQLKSGTGPAASGAR
jgi:protein phosphatase